jgi:hypothetical protein
LLEIYPDAKVIHTHRDPAVVVQSFISLIASLRLMRSDAFDAVAASEMLNAGMVRNLEKVIDEREKGLLPRDQIADVHFGDLMRDPLGEIARVYAQLGLEFTSEARDAIAGYIRARPRTKHGEHVYAFSDVVDLRRERERYARYVEYYGIEREA